MLTMDRKLLTNFFRKNQKINDQNIRSLKKITDENSPFQFVEAYKSLRTNIDFVSVNKRYQTIEITSAIPKEGKSGIAINLSISFVEIGKKVILIDADLRKPMLSTYLGENPADAKGLSTVLTGCDLYASILHTKFHFDFLPAGLIPPNPVELLGSRQMGEILCELRNEYDFIVIDTPPVSLLTDAVTLCQFVDGIIFVIRQKTASIDQIKFAMKKLESVKANVIGAILNDYVAPKDSSQSKNYYNNYSDYYQHK